MKCKLYLLDEVNVGFDGLQEYHIDKIIKETKLMKKGAFMSPAFQMKVDDGMESQFQPNGRTFFYMLEKVLPMVEEWGYDIEVIDDRNTLPDIPHIDKDLFNYVDRELMEHQVDATNGVIDVERGIINVATSGGKSYIAGAITKVYDEHLDFIIIVPTEKLVKQIYEDFNFFGLDIGHITKNMSPKKRKEEWGHKHMVCTWRLLNNNRNLLERFGGFIYDEVHIMGDVMFKILTNELSHSLIRIGMTGTLPKDEHKREKILCRIGSDSIIVVKPKELQDKKIISTCDIKMFPIQHTFVLDDIVMSMIEEWEWTDEESYLHNNPTRIKKIGEMIDNYSAVPTLILCHKKLANNLKKMLGYDMIDGDTPESIREEYYHRLETEKDYPLIATYDTVGTGTSIDSIVRMFLIDVGKNDTRITQGIGRGLRKDGLDNHLEVIDIFMKLCYVNPKTDRLNEFSFSGGKHLNIRKKLYEELHYPYKMMPKIII